MKGIEITKFGSPEEAFSLNDIAVQEPKEDEVLIEVESFGVNYADIMARQGLYGEAPPLPFVPGYEVVGKVTKTGKNASSFLGKRILGFTRFGGYASHAISNISAILELNEETNGAHALSLATQYATAYYACFYAQTIRENEIVLIQASAGGVGIAINQLCKNAGAITIGLCSNSEKMDFCRKQGYDHVFNYTSDDYLEQIKQLFPDGIDVCFNSLAGKSFKQDKSLLNHTGRMVLYGGASRSGMRGGTLASLKMVWQMGLIIPLGFMMGSKSLIGINMLKVADFKPNIIKTCLAEVFKLYQNGQIKPVIGKEFGVSEINQAHQYIEDRSSIGKIVCHWNN